MHGKLIEVLFLRLRPHTPSFKAKGKAVYNNSRKTDMVNREKKQLFFRQSATTIENSNNIYFSFF